MKNLKIRFALMANNMTHYQLAMLMGVSEFTLSRKLRIELPEEEQNKIIRLIEEARNAS